MTEIIKYTIGMSNGYFVRENGNLIAVDCGSELNLDAFLDVCKKNDINPKDIQLIIPTHAHVDHYINIGPMRGVSGAAVLCHRLSAPKLKVGALPMLFPRTEKGYFIMQHVDPEKDGCKYAPPVDPDLIFEKRFDLRPYGISGYIMETPGHTMDGISIILDDRRALVGDLIVDGMHEEAALPYFCYPEPEICTPIIHESIKKVLEVADIYYSGHGGPYYREDVIKALEEELASKN